MTCVMFCPVSKPADYNWIPKSRILDISVLRKCGNPVNSDALPRCDVSPRVYLSVVEVSAGFLFSLGNLSVCQSFNVEPVGTQGALK